MSRLLRHLPLFSNLAELSVVSVTAEELSCVALLAILQNSPRLQVINLEVVTSFITECLSLFTDPYNFLHCLFVFNNAGTVAA